MTSVFFKSMRKQTHFPVWLPHFAHFPAIHGNSKCSTSSLALDIISTFYFNLSNKCVLVAHYGFRFNFLMANNVEHSFMGLFAILLVRYLLKFFSHLRFFKFLYCWVLKVLNIFWIQCFRQYVFFQISPIVEIIFSFF